MKLAALKILLVEDSVLTLEQVHELIKSTDSRVVISTATTEKDAIAAVTEAAPDIVVLDLRLKQGSGFNVLKQIAPLHPKPAIIVLTNYALPKFREYAMLTGADYFLDKAMEMEALPDVIKLCANNSTLH